MKLKQYVQSQYFARTAEIMPVMKEMFLDAIQQVMEVKVADEFGRKRCQRIAGDTTTSQLLQRVITEDDQDPAGQNLLHGPQRLPGQL